MKSPLFYFGTGMIFLVIFLYSLGIVPLKERFIASSRGNFRDGSQYLSADQTLFASIFDLNMFEDSALMPAAPPYLVQGKILGALGETGTKEEIEEYIVENGDNLSSVAEKFGISLETLLWANDLSTTSAIQPGQKLVILPVSGVLHIVQEGDTLSELAQLYKAGSEDIVDFNGLSDGGEIFSGDLLIIPGGKKPKIAQRYVQVPLSQSYFIYPLPSPSKISQGLHWYNAVDFSNGKCGEPVFAAAGGEVQRTGYGSVSGYYVRILHPNGAVTFYGHLSKIAVKPGEKVYQGRIIGYVGYSGKTIPAGPAGCHLHFDVRFAKNPFGYR